MWHAGTGKAEIGIFLTLTPPTKPMVAEAAAVGQYEEDGFSPACHDNAFEKAAREEDKKAQGKLAL